MAIGWYLIGFTNGRLIFDGGGMATEQELLRKGASITDWDNDYEVKQYPTANIAEAKKMWKSDRLGETGSFGKSLIRAYGLRTVRRNKDHG